MDKTRKTLFCLALVILLFAACNGEEAEPAPPPPEEQVVEEPQVSPLEACASGISVPNNPSYSATYCENFEDAGAVMMPLGEEEDKYVAMTLDVYNGKYTARVEVKRDSILTLTVPAGEVRDFTLQVEGRLASYSGHPYHSWGVFFKAEEEGENYYYFLIDNNEYYYFQLIRGDRQTNLINGRRTEDLNPLEEGNTITIVCEGDTYTFYINGEYMEEFSDNRLLTGEVGIYLVMDKGATLDWEFDNIAVYSP